MSDKPESSTGFKRGRSHRTRRSVKVADTSARALITIGGIGTIVAVCGVFLFLVWVVKDLFLGADVGEQARLAAELAGEEAVAVGSDEYRTIGWTLSRDGRLRVVRLDSRELLTDEQLFDPNDAELTASARDLDGRTVTLGFANGSVRILSIEFETGFREVEDVPVELRELPPGSVATFEAGTVERTSRGQFRLQRAIATIDAPEQFTSGAAIVDLHRATQRGDPVVAVLDSEGGVVLRRQTRKLDFMTGVEKVSWGDAVEVPLDTTGGVPRFVRVTDLGNQLSVCWADGTLLRYSIRSFSEPVAAESVDLVDGEARLTALGVLLGGSTLIAGSSDGHVSGWFVVPDEASGVDGIRFVNAHRFDLGSGSEVTAIAASSRERVFVVGTRDGFVDAFYMTSGKRLASLRTKRKSAITACAVSPKTDALLVADAGGLVSWEFDPRYPEAGFRSLFGKVWYERYPESSYVWQSSSGTDDFEPKLSLVPLVFGTIKATFYSMLLAVPLALLAAIYTSEFLHRKTRARVKPIIELMASLPSVVLGFFAAVVIAPMVKTVLPAVIASALTIPFAVLLGAFLWQWIPIHRSLRLEALRVPLNAVALGIGIGGAVLLGPAVESVFFAGDLFRWLDGQEGTGGGLGGWVLLMFPWSALAVMWIMSRRVNPWVRQVTVHMDRGREGLVHLAKFGVATLAFLGIAWVLGSMVHHAPQVLGGEAWDLRAGLSFGSSFELSPFGTYDPRNALIVGFIMGFAVIPIIYTIAEDALSSVPEHLRAASLGAGATQWQTAVRVIIPTAMSGLFSACMIGLGRAVGETMIVLMAAGNTPVLTMNVFSGFRTLSANIATELPEAVRDSTHYRTLFLAALVLFAMTFAINTVAESVRQRFRRRAYQL